MESKKWPAVLCLALQACGGGKGSPDAFEEWDPDLFPDSFEVLPADCPEDGTVSEGFHVSPAGTPEGDGSETSPWDLATALAHPIEVEPGDAIWLHGGTYAGSFTSVLAGADGSRITVSAYPGERPVIDGAGADETTLSIEGSWTDYRGFEVTNSWPDRWAGREEGMYVVGEHVRLINLVLHDLGNNGFWTPALDLWIYGCLIYNNGYDDSDRAHGHGIYTQNLEGTKHIVDNIIFDGYSYGIHAYTEGGSIQGFDIVGNVWFQSGVAAAGTDTRKDDCLVGGLQPADRVLLQDNMGWADAWSERSVRLGYEDLVNGSVALHGNYFAGATIFAAPWTEIEMSGNTFYGEVEGVDASLYSDNAFLAETERPTGSTVFVRPNLFEPGRAHIVVYNWDLADSVEVDISGVLDAGASYKIMNAQDFLSDPVATGVFDGSPVSLPMTGLEPAQPVGMPDAIDPSETTGPEFNVFVLAGGC